MHIYYIERWIFVFIVKLQKEKCVLSFSPLVIGSDL